MAPIGVASAVAAATVKTVFTNIAFSLRRYAEQEPQPKGCGSHDCVGSDAGGWRAGVVERDECRVVCPDWCNGRGDLRRWQRDLRCVTRQGRAELRECNALGAGFRAGMLTVTARRLLWRAYVRERMRETDLLDSDQQQREKHAGEASDFSGVEQVTAAFVVIALDHTRSAGFLYRPERMVMARHATRRAADSRCSITRALIVALHRGGTG
jgi:hypothetical protein